MTKQQGILGLVGICLLMIVFSLAGLASDFITHLLCSIDGLLLFGICLMMIGIFALMLLAMAKEEGWLPSRHAKAAETAPAAKPAAAAKPAETVPAGPGEGK